MTAAICEVLEWDSTFFGIKIGRVLGETLCEKNIAEIARWAANESIECVYFLASASDELTTSLAQEHGFVLVDVRTTFDRSLMDRQALSLKRTALTRQFMPVDLTSLRAIARTGHQDTRFYQDHNFPRGRCDALYDEWITKSCTGWADAVWVAELNDEPVGYITCHLDANNLGRIGLVAVDARFHRLGIGRDLLAAALEWFSGSGVARVSVVTQGRNLKAVQFYTNGGFSLSATAFWFHKWFGTQVTK